MKMRLVLSMIFMTILALTLVNCNKDDPTKDDNATLEVFVKKNFATGAYMPGITVELFKTVNDQAAGTVFKTATTPTVDFTENGALFEDLAEQVYYIKVAFTDSGKVYEGMDQISVLNKVENSIDIIALSLGSFQVFVREGNKNGPYVGDAKVELFLTEEDRTNDNPSEVKYTPSADFDKNGAMFENLPYQKYFLRASYTNTQGYWVGVNEGYAEKGKIINKHITCVL